MSKNKKTKITVSFEGMRARDLNQMESSIIETVKKSPDILDVLIQKGYLEISQVKDD